MQNDDERRPYPPVKFIDPDNWQPYTYDWYKNGHLLSAVEPTIHFTAELADAGSYAVIVTDSQGLIIKSTVMVLTVIPAGANG